jgi:hypothetical protein
VLEQQPARRRADRQADGRGAGPHADGPAPLAGVGEHVGDDRQGGRHDERPADAHDRPEGDQRPGGPAERRERGAEAEGCEPEGERPVAAEAVAQAAGGEQQSGEDQDVGVDHPLQVAVGRPEAALGGRPGEGGQGHVEDAVVDDDDDEAEAQDGQRQPAPAIDKVGVELPVAHGGSSPDLIR